MVLQVSAISNVIINAFGAMSKVAIIAAVGYYFALYPKSDPYFSPKSLKYVSKISNSVCLPALIISSIGSGLSLALLSRMSMLIIFSIFTSIISFSLAATLGKMIDGKSNLYLPLYIAIASPNIVSLPLMILQTMCDEAIINADYSNDSIKCFNESSSMIFVYSIGTYYIMK
jgi:predicted permease